jgi:hypothetical protein
MGMRASTTRLIALCLLLAGLSAAVAGCSDGSTEPSTTSVSDTGVTTTTLPELMSDTERMLADTARTQNQFAEYLTAQKAADSDPRMAIFFGLRARTQALSCRNVIEKSLAGGTDSAQLLEVADSAMLDLYEAMNKAQAIAAGTVAQTLTDARAIVATLGAPSAAPEAAVTLLDQFVSKTAPLLDEATALMPTTTTIPSATSS